MNKKSKVLLRIASALILVHLAGHSLGHSGWKHPQDPKMQEVVNAMLGYKAGFMGATKSMGDYYDGYSLMMIVLYAASILLLWRVSCVPDDQKATARKVLLPMGLLYAAFGVIEYLYFFPFAASMSMGAGILTLGSLFLLRD
jgi:hypothetical protein